MCGILVYCRHCKQVSEGFQAMKENLYHPLKQLIASESAGKNQQQKCEPEQLPAHHDIGQSLPLSTINSRIGNRGPDS